MIEICPIFLQNSPKKLTFRQKSSGWRFNQEWRLIDSDTVYNFTMLYKLFCKGIPLCCNIINIKMSHLIVKEIYILIYAVTFSFSAEHLPENEVLTYQNFVVLASQKFPGIWHRLFDQPLYIDFGGVSAFAVEVWSWKLFQI